jgi:2-polyprenyl-3-methyl-5-hydroxy-6-metoxy-1,4-benzoquinol methylase
VRALVVTILLLGVGCTSREPKTQVAPTDREPPKHVARATAVLPVRPPADDPALAREQQEYVADVAAFTNTTPGQVRERMKQGSVPLKHEWEAWEAEGPMTDARMKAFYKQTANYLYELGEWHLFVADKRASDVALVADLARLERKRVLDFGGGVGLNAIMLARAGLDVTLADLESTSLAFAAFRAKRHGVSLAIWKTDVDPLPPYEKYDVILALDVLEHLPKAELDKAVETLIRLKHADTQVIMSAPFGRTAVHPMHLDADEHTRAQVQRLLTELPAS